MFIKMWLIRLGVPYSSLSGSLKQRVYLFFGMGFCSVLGWVFFAAFWDGVLQRPASKFYQGLESNSYGHYRVFGGDQSLGACNSRVD